VGLRQKALASADAFPKDIFEAEVIYINPGVDLQRASVEVKLRVLSPPAYLRQDMTVSVDIETARHAGALVAPAESVRGLATAQPWVMKVEGRRAKRQPVSLGLVGAGKAEILDGLNEGDRVVSATAVKDGARIRARTAAGGAR
jgi:HlyD family secretion protein